MVNQMKIKKSNVFNPAKVKALLSENKKEEVKDYLKKFYFCTSENFFFLDNIKNKFLSLSTTQIEKKIPGGLDNEDYLEQNNIKKNRNTRFSVLQYLKSSEFRNVDNYCYNTVDFSLPRGLNIPEDEDEIAILNMTKNLNIDTTKEINLDDYEEDIKAIDDHIYNVLTSKDKLQYEYFKNFIAFSFAGVKVLSCIYIQSLERTGKGVYLNFINDILGDRMLKSSNVETITPYTKPLEGKCLINFDELPALMNNNIQDKLKGLITEDTFDCRSMYEIAYPQKNTFNIIITTNNNAIKFTNSNNMRYISLDVSNEKRGDTQYFKKLLSHINKKGVKEAYYKYMIEHYKNNIDFNFTKIPKSKSRTMKINYAMPLLVKFIKESFVLKNKDLKIQTKELQDDFNSAYQKNHTLITIGKEMNLYFNMEKVRKNKSYYWIMKHKDLMKIYKKNDWIVEEHDEFEENDKKDFDDDNQHIEKLEETLIKEREEKDELKKQIKELQKQLKKISKSNDEEDDILPVKDEELRAFGLNMECVENYKKAQKEKKAKAKKTVKKTKTSKVKINDDEEKELKTVEYKNKLIKNKKDLTLFFD